MTEVNLKEMLEAGVHFGHKTDKWNPKMRPFIFTQRNGVHIFDLAKTKEGLEAAGKFVGNVVSEGGLVLFVGTKNQTKAVIKEAAERAGMPYLIDRWPGGMLTNFNTVSERLKYMKDAEEKTEAGAGMTKKEILNLKRELEKLSNVFEGVKDVHQLPQALFVADIVKERIAVREAKRLGIPVVGIADTNALPDIEYVIPANDDAVRSVKYIADYLAECINAKKRTVTAANDESKESSATEESADEAEAGTAVEVKDESAEKLDKIEMKAAEETVVKKNKEEE